jgi:hypothetical protein
MCGLNVSDRSPQARVAPRDHALGPFLDSQLVAVGGKRDEVSPPARTEVVDADVGRDPREPGAD